MQYAVVTGGSQGIGKAISDKLLHQGYSIAVCARNATDLKAAEAEWQAQYPEATIITFPADLSNKEDVTRFAAHVLQSFPQIDILVNNAGTYQPGLIAEEPDGQLEHLMGINLYSAYYVTRALLPAMVQQQEGHIFNICSIAALKAYPNGGSYSISKYALLGFSDNLREELKPHRIKVTAIFPGAVHTRSWAGSGVPQERIMQASDVADMLWAAYSLSSAADVEHIVMRPLAGDL